MPPELNLDAYLHRIGLDGPVELPRLHHAHATTIPFENLDPRRGIVPSLAPAALEAKLVAGRRGGYCFEHNLLLAQALTELGFGVELMVGRVRVGAEPGVIRGLTHLCLRVNDGDRVWHADVGFGAACPLHPIPFGPGDVHEQFGWRYQVVIDGDEYVLRTEARGEWVDLYSFIPRPAPLIDAEVGNWYAGAHPDSGFVTGLIVVCREPDGTRLSLSDWGSQGLTLTRSTPDEHTQEPVAPADVPALLDKRFGLPGFTLGAGGRIVPG